MRFGPVPLTEAAGKILAHTILAPDGKKLFGKGRVLNAADVETLHTLNFSSVVVAALEPTDLSENEGARRVGTALTGDGIRMVAPGVGRANLMAEAFGPLRINVPVLERINNIYEGITVTTLRTHSVVQPGQLVALIKIIPFAIPASCVEDVEALAHDAQPVIAVRPLRAASVALIVSGPMTARAKLLREFQAPVQTRIERLGSKVEAVCYVEHTSPAIAEAIRQVADLKCDLVLLAGVSAIMDRDDVAPQAVRAAGGSVTHFGVPVDPGSLLMLGYVGNVPVVGAPGCVKSLKTNVIDWVLPRLLAGERLTRADLVAMGHGGLLDDIEDRPMPREISTNRSDDQE